jgi:hypothetical protein
MKIKEEQLNEIRETQRELNQTLTDIGILESQKHALLHKIKTINEKDVEVRKRLEEEYGAVNINIEDGTYTPIEEKVEENV